MLILSAITIIASPAIARCDADAPLPPQRKPPRVLLFASAPTREFQFLSTLLLREDGRKRAEVFFYVQPLPGKKPREDVSLGVPPDRLLKRFPDKFNAETAKPEEKRYELAEYDVIVAFDPYWPELTEEQLAQLAKWVEKSAGGLIAIGGPINTVELARPPGPDGAKLGPIIGLYPVELLDMRLVDQGRRTDKPFRLTTLPVKDYPFLQLEPRDKEPTGGWESYFGDPKKEERGFFNCYPVKGIKPDAVVLATFADPAMKMKDGTERPFLVTRPTEKGRVVYIGSGELWRLRQYREAYHERLWLGLINHARGVAAEMKKEEKP